MIEKEVFLIMLFLACLLIYGVFLYYLQRDLTKKLRPKLNFKFWLFIIGMSILTVMFAWLFMSGIEIFNEMTEPIKNQVNSL